MLYTGQMTTVCWSSIYFLLGLARGLSLYRRQIRGIFSQNAPVPEFCSPRLSNESPVGYACVCLAIQICTMFSWCPLNTACVQDFWYPSASRYAKSVQQCRHHCLYTNIWSVCELWFGVWCHESVFYCAPGHWLLVRKFIFCCLLQYCIYSLKTRDQKEKCSIWGSLWGFLSYIASDVILVSSGLC